MVMIEKMLQVTERLSDRLGLANSTGNSTVSSLVSVATGMNLVRACANCYLAHTMSGRIFYGVSTVLSTYSLVGTFCRLSLGHSPFHKSILGSLGASFTANVAGRVCDRIHECENLSTAKLTMVCLEELLQESKPLKDYFDLK